MKITSRIRKITLGIAALMVCVLSCKDDYESDAGDPQLPLSADGVSLKAPGKGQYRIATNLVDGQAVITVDLTKLASVSSLSVTKYVDGTLDETFGTGGTQTISAPGNDSYDYEYTLLDSDLDRLVVLSFKASDGSKVLVSDLSLTVSLTPRENIPRKKWQWTSRLWVTGGNAQDLKQCEADNYFLFNADSTITVNYGADTGAGDCLFDGFTVYDKWWLTADDKYFIIQSHGLFDPTVKTDSNVVKTLSVPLLEWQIGIDLSVFGLGTDEQFLYQYTAQPK